MITIWKFLLLHSTMAALAAYYVVSSAVSSMSAPSASSGNFYRWFFSFANTLAANISRARSTTLEGSPNWDAAMKKATNGLTAPVANQQKPQG